MMMLSKLTLPLLSTSCKVCVPGLTAALRMLAYAALHSGDSKRARTLANDSLKRNLALGDGHHVGVLACLLALAEIDLAGKNHTRAARLYGFIRALDRCERIQFQEPDRCSFERVEAALKTKKALQAKIAAGEKLTLETLLENL